MPTVYRLSVNDWNQLDLKSLEVGDEIEFDYEPLFKQIITEKRMIAYETKREGRPTQFAVVSMKKVKRNVFI